MITFGPIKYLCHAIVFCTPDNRSLSTATLASGGRIGYVLLNDLMGITHLPSGLLNEPERQELVFDSSLARNNASGIVFKVQDTRASRSRDLTRRQ